MLAFLTRRKETPMPQTTTAAPTDQQTDDSVVMRFLTQGGATIELRHHTWTATFYRDGKVYRREDKRGFEWNCAGCDTTGADQNLRLAGHGYEEHEPHNSRREANDHAAGCWAMPKPSAA